MGTANQNRFTPNLAPELTNYPTPQERELVAKSRVEACQKDLRAAIAAIDADQAYYSVAGEARSILNDLLLMHRDLQAVELFPYSYELEACREAGNKIRELTKNFKPSPELVPSGLFKNKYKIVNFNSDAVLYLAGGVAIFILIIALLNRVGKKH